MALLIDHLPPPPPGRDPSSLSQSLMEHAAKVERLERIAAGFKASASALVARVARKSGAHLSSSGARRRPG